MSLLLYILLAVLVVRLVMTSVQSGAGRQTLASRDAELGRLREEVDTLQAEVRRLAEEQTFLVRLLSEGDRPGGALPPPETFPDPNPEKP
jgi:uncharacterized protein YlxW (UPF0749 family)